MGVVIDEMEVISGDAGERASDAPPASITDTETSSPTTQEIERIVQRQVERYERIRAH
jgi:hypothetical protein